MKSIIIDLDGTLTIDSDMPYDQKKPNTEVVKTLQKYHEDGFNIVIHTARNMRTYYGNLEEIKINTLPIIIEWLKENEVPYDQIVIGKPWCGHHGFYVDDKAIRPSEFASLKHEEIIELLKKENPFFDGGNK